MARDEVSSKPAKPLDNHEDEKKPKLDALEEIKARKQESLDQKVTYDVVRREGNKELERPHSALWWAAVAGGLSMGFSFVAEALLRAHLPDADWRPLITKLGYPVGFLIISLGSQQLFTENTVTPIVPLLISYTAAKLRKVITLSIVVLLGNLVGALIFASVVGLTQTFEPEVHEAFAAIGHEALAGTFTTTLVRGVFAGWLIALMVWMLPAASHSKVAVIIIMTYIVGIGGLSHVIVGSVETLYLVVTGEIPAVIYVFDFLLPTVIGNLLGGIILVSWLNHAQVTSGNAHRK
ncbi:MAG: formate/nitrite transporter family protein [Gemmatimonadaceae bacterium]